MANRSESYRPLDGEDCCCLDTEGEPCWGEMTNAADLSEDPIYLCEGHEFAFSWMFHFRYRPEGSDLREWTDANIAARVTP